MSIKIDNGFVALTESDTGMTVYIKGSSITALRQASSSAKRTIVESPSMYGNFVVTESPAEILQAIGESYKQARASR